MTTTVVNGYPVPASVCAGQALTLHVSTRQARFRADFYRVGAQARYVESCQWPGEYMPDGPAGADWRWPGYDFGIPSDWSPGVYVAVLDGTREEPAEYLNAEDIDARSGRILFVVKPKLPRAGSVLYKLPLSTYHAYNQAGGASLYGSCDPSIVTQVSIVNLKRPGGGIGGPVKGLPDHYDPATPRQTFAHWDAKFLAWLEQEHIPYDVCTDLDIHDGMGLSDYHFLISAGHDEYWTETTRERVEAFRRHGGNLAIFGANTCWWRTHLNTNNGVLTCDKFPPGAKAGIDPDTAYGSPDKWWETRPENSLIGVSYRNAGGHWDGPRSQIGFTVQDAKHWIFDGIGVVDGDVIGGGDTLIGYECDGAAVRADRYGQLQPTYEDGTPIEFRVLGSARLPEEPGAGWNFPSRGVSPVVRAATLGLHAQYGVVFNAATTDWPRVLQTNPAVQSITRNVIDRLWEGVRTP